MEREISALAKAEDIINSREDVLVQFFILREEVKKMDTTRAAEQFTQLRLAGKKAKNCLMLIFTGYDSDSREIYQIPEAREYLRKLLHGFPELFYFLDIESYTFAIAANAVFMEQAEVTEAEQAMTEFAKKVGDTDRVITPSYYAANQAAFHK